MIFNTEEKSWKDFGGVQFRAAKEGDSGKSKMIMRNMMGKVMFNSYFFKGIKFEKLPKGIKFVAPFGEKNEVKMIMAKITNQAELDKFYNKLVSCI